MVATNKEEARLLSGLVIIS